MMGKTAMPSRHEIERQRERLRKRTERGHKNKPRRSYAVQPPPDRMLREAAVSKRNPAGAKRE